MAAASCSDEDFIALFRVNGAAGTARILGITDRAVFLRRRNLEAKLDFPILQFHAFENYPARMPLKIENGIVLVGSDGHIWPGERPVAQRAFIKFGKDLAPSAIILNGDCFDGARISRHPPLGFQDKPTVRQELDAVQDFLTDVILTAPKARHLWTLGNHDARFEASLASSQAKECEGVNGFSLKDHFTAWTFATSIWINDDVVVKHRVRTGIHGTTLGPLWAGKTVVMGHMHSLQVRPLSDYNGTRWGVDTGTLADVRGPQFDYGEDNPTNHRAGFVVLTFVKGRLLWPETVSVIDETQVEFRGQIITV